MQENKKIIVPMSPSYRYQRRTLHEQNDYARIQVLVVVTEELNEG